MKREFDGIGIVLLISFNKLKGKLARRQIYLCLYQFGGGALPGVEAAVYQNRKNNSFKIKSEQIEQMSEELAYLLGAFRDGGIGIYKGKRKKDYKVYIAQYKNYGNEWLEIIKKMFQDTFHVHVTIVKGFLSISNKNLFYFLHNECGIGPNGKRWLTPRWIFYSSDKIKAAYVRGFLDAEGSILNKKNNNVEIQISQKDRVVLEELKEILLSLSINSSVCKSREIFKLSIAGKNSVMRLLTEINSFHPNNKLKIEKAVSILSRKLDSTPGTLPA